MEDFKIPMTLWGEIIEKDGHFRKKSLGKYHFQLTEKTFSKIKGSEEFSLNLNCFDAGLHTMSAEPNL